MFPLISVLYPHKVMEEDGRIENLFKYWHLHNKDGQRNICC